MLIDSFWFRMHNEKIFSLDMLWIYSLVTSLAITAQLNLLVGDVSGCEDSEMCFWIQFSLCDREKEWRILSIPETWDVHIMVTRELLQVIETFDGTRCASQAAMCTQEAEVEISQISTLLDLIYSSMSASKSHHKREMWRKSSRCFIIRDETNDVDTHQAEIEQLSRRCGMRK